MNDHPLSQEHQSHQSLTHRGYRLHSTLNEVAARQLLDKILEKSYSVKKVFKDSRSSYAAHLQVGNENLIHKIPRARLKRTWEKLITLFRDGESIRTFDNLLLMLQLGFKAPTPILAGERRRNGFIVDSFCCYRFADGKEAGANDAQQVTTELLRLHSKGYLRTDAKPPNFLISAEGVTFIDFRLKKPFLFSKLRKEIALASFIQGYPESLAHIPEEIRTSTSFGIASWLDKKLVEIKATRRRIKRLFKST